MGSCCDEFLWELGVRGATSAVLAYVVLARTNKGLAGPRVLERARCRCCGTE